MRQIRQAIRIVIADENVLFRRGLRALFSGDSAFIVAGEANDANAVIGSLLEHRPAVLVLHSALLHADTAHSLGVTMRRLVPTLQILLVTDQDKADVLAMAMQIGAKGLVRRDMGTTELLAALRNVAFGEGDMNQAGLLPDLRALQAQTLPRPVTTTLLTAREQEVARLLAEGKTVRAVANDLALSAKTIEAHKLNLMRKLDIHDRATLVAYATRTGLTAPVAVAQ